MPGLMINRFEGIYPRVPASLLPERAASVAENVDFSEGHLQSINAPFKLFDTPFIAKSAFSEDGLRFYVWNEDVNAVISPVLSGTSTDRLYFTTATDFRVTLRSLATTTPAAPAASYRVGTPKPTVAPVITLSGGTTGADDEARAYVYTYVNIYDEEGPPSVPVLVTVFSGATVNVRATIDNFGQYVPIKEVRFYRTANTGISSDYYFALSISAIGATAGSTVNVGDTVPSGSLNELLPSLNNYPPDPALVGLMNIGNGIFAAWTGNKLAFSDAYRPWAWNPANVKTFPYNIVGGLSQGSGAIITTVGNPYMVVGVTPETMSDQKLNVQQAGISKWAMCDMGSALAYASQDGIVIISGGSGSLDLSQRYFTRKTWADRYGAALTSMQLVAHDGGLIAFSRTGAFTPFLLRTDESAGAMTDLPSFVASSAFYLVTSDGMYFTNGTAIYQFAGGAAQALRWQSRETVMPRPISLAIMQTRCTAGAFSIQIYCDGVLQHTQAVGVGVETHRLPSMDPSKYWTFNVTGTGILKEVYLARSGRELGTI